MRLKVGRHMKVGLLIMAAGLAMSPAHLLAEAENQARFYATQGSGSPMKGFFNKGSARTVFSDPAGEEARASIQYFPSKKPIEAEEELAPETAPEAQPAKLAQPAQEAKAEQKTAKTKEEKREELVKNYGAPDEEAPVQAQENAPKPFRAMMAALETGDDELARSYARQYVRYMARLQQRTTRVVGLMGGAMVREGFMEKNSWQDSPEFRKDREAYQREVQDSASSGTVELTGDAARLVREAQELEEDASPARMRREVPQDESPAAIRMALSGKVPVDPGVNTKILFFFRPYDAQSQEMARNLQVVYQAALKLGGRDITAIPLEEISPEQEQLFRERTGITFSINPAGSSIAALMDIRSVPATAITSPRLEQVYVVGGVKRAPYVFEVLNMMEGR